MSQEDIYIPISLKEKFMSKVRPYDFGRVFFLDKSNSIPDKIYFQPLGNHVANVRRLVKLWDIEDFPGNNEEDKLKSKARVDEAARIHDIGKPYRFKLEVKKTKQGKFKEYIYSFKGHRFLAESSNEWAKMLAIGHHDFSVNDICRDSYKLKKNSSDYQDILTQDSLAYARELYILEMCDQIEAELACRIIGNDEQAESRAFMDFTTTKLDDDNLNYSIDPWPFEKKEIPLSFVYWSMELSQDDKNSLKKLLDSPEKLEIEINKLVEKWWKDNRGKPPREIPKIATLKQNESLDITDKWNCETFYKKLGGENFNPNPMQKEMWEEIFENYHPTVLLKSPTGSGKLEAILFPSLAKNHRLILPLPARSLIDDQKERIAKYIQIFSQLPENQNREFSLVIDTGSQMYRQVYQNGKEVKRNINPRRHLYKGDVILTTIDKFIYRYFAFGDKQKSFIFPLRINHKKTLICFDEAHSYENIAFTNFSSLVKSLYEAGRSLVLMTATLPPEHLKYFDYFEPVIDYIDDSEKAEKLEIFQQVTLKYSHPEKSFEWRDEQLEKIPDILLTEWKKAKTQMRIITVVETVKDAVKIYQEVKDELGSKTDKQEQFIFLYHGRLDQYQRPEIYQKLKQRDENNLPYILITTSAIEVGCDLNSQILISEICPPENLIQRAGRCNRKGNISDAKVIVVGKKIKDFVNTLDQDSWQKYQETLKVLKSNKQFHPQKISECISRSQQVNDYRVIELFSMLHDYVYGADLTCQPLHKKGLIITRSWTPSATLVYDDGTKEDSIENIHKMPQVTVPVDRLIIKENQTNKYTNLEVYEHYYNQEETRWSLRPLGWGCAYQKNIVVKIKKSNEGAFVPDGKQEYNYVQELGFIELPGIFIKLKTHNLDEKLLFKQDDSEQKSASIFYIKTLEISK
ncbi:MAG: CRISPR-associated helicase Cas3' [Microcoleaceae cyanobacterium]